MTKSFQNILLPDLPSAAPLSEAVLFAFDDHGFPFRKSAEVRLIPAANPGMALECGTAGSHDEQILYYGTTLKIGDTFHMWYNGNSGPIITPSTGGERRDWRLCYATSKDGAHWEKPALGLVEFGGSKRNNIVALDAPELWSSGAVLHDPEDPDPARRFKLVYENSTERPESRARFNSRQYWCVAFSEDGLRWTNSKANPMGGFFEMCGITRRRGLYYVNGQAGLTAHGQRAVRRLCTYASSDFEHWSPAAAMGLDRARDLIGPSSAADNSQDEEVHLGAAMWNRGNVILGIYGMWHGHPSGDRHLTTMDLGLALSHDAIRFREPIPGFRLVPAREQPGNVAGLSPALMQGQGMENHEDRTLYWYSCWRGYEGRGVRRVSWERDRLGYLKPFRSTGAQVISCPIQVLDGSGEVFLNVSGLGEHARLRVGLSDEGFRPVPGAAGDEAAVIAESGLRVPVRWKRTPAIAPAMGKVRLDIQFEGVRPEDIRLHAVYIGRPAVV